MNPVWFEFFHHIVAFYVHNNIVIYFEHRKTVPEELLHPAYMYPSCNQISYSTDLCYITQSHKKFSLTSLLIISHLSHVIADFGLCHIHVTLDLNYPGRPLSRNQGELRIHFKFSEVRDKQIVTTHENCHVRSMLYK